MEKFIDKFITIVLGLPHFTTALREVQSLTGPFPKVRPAWKASWKESIDP